ncbi:globin domain-containing protein [Corynebacterium halotolerans]|uniref:nitric oxide dioxygenase n=1 Tax=Corynebacterium halotolerans YIM 70093 = DSM 44683 TaxID=1121362 RepID=M1NVC5_9CORY|nr:globin domain-containing protein [Corynebacterium halotolerans]AGF73437.1 hypothetical protein A605_12205 [Corynebacterium halotolerans YIM 70093 = DSM 44683]
MFVTTQPTRTRHLTPEHEETIKATLPLVGGQIEEIARVFYRTMFGNHPELLANTFNRGNQKSSAQQKALAASIATFAKTLVDPEAPDPVDLLGRIAHKHVSLGITEDQYQVVHDNLFAAIVEVLGADVVTADVAEAWDEVYWLMAETLIGHEDALYASANVEPGDVFRDVTVTAKEELTGTVTMFTLSGEGLTKPRPGQYTSVGVKLPDGARQLRQYSLLDGSADEYRIAVARDGEVSAFLQDNVEVGDRVQATLAAGDLVLAEGSDAPVVLASNGIGSTPMVGMLARLVENGSDREIVVLHGDDSEATDAQREQTRALVEQLPNASLHTFYRDNGELVTVDAVPADADVYLCGGNQFLQSMRAQLAGLPEGRAPREVHYELFSPNDWLL